MVYFQAELMHEREENRLTLMFHGYGNNEVEMTRILDAVYPERAARPSSITFRAPYERPYIGGYYWYPDGCDVETRRAETDRIINYLDERLFTALAGSFRLSLMGFSQGGYLAYRLAQALPERFEKAVLLSPSFKGEKDAELPQSKTRFLLCYGSEDRTIPLEDQRNAYDVLGKTGRLTFRAYERLGHAVSAEEIKDIRAFLDD